MTQPPPPDWSARLAFAIAGEVRRHRQAQGLSAQQLADRCATIGMPIQRSVLANLESGRRTTVNVAEVLVLAQALKVPPGALIFPVGYDTHTEVLPGAWTQPATATDWLSGHAFFNHETADAFPDTPLALIRAHEEAAEDLRKAIEVKERAVNERFRFTAQHEQDARSYEELRAEAQIALKRLNQIAAAAKKGEDFDYSEGEQLSARHETLTTQMEAVATGAGMLRHAEQNLAAAESRVRTGETSLRAIREKIKSQGFVAPILPRKLIYIDPESTAFEDFPVKPEIQMSADRVLETAIPTSEEGASGEQAELDLLRENITAEGARMMELLNELEPRLTKAIEDAITKALSGREQEEE